MAAILSGTVMVQPMGEAAPEVVEARFHPGPCSPGIRVPLPIPAGRFSLVKQLRSCILQNRFAPIPIIDRSNAEG